VWRTRLQVTLNFTTTLTILSSYKVAFTPELPGHLIEIPKFI